MCKDLGLPIKEFIPATQPLTEFSIFTTHMINITVTEAPKNHSIATTQIQNILQVQEILNTTNQTSNEPRIVPNILNSTSNSNSTNDSISLDQSSSCPSAVKALSNILMFSLALASFVFII